MGGRKVFDIIIEGIDLDLDNLVGKGIGLDDLMEFLSPFEDVRIKNIHVPLL